MFIDRMKRRILVHLFLASLLLVTSCGREAGSPANDRVVRCAVIGGMTMTGLWPEIAKMFEAEKGYQVEVVVTGPRPELDTAMRAGKVDFLTMHSGDITTDLVAHIVEAAPGHGCLDYPAYFEAVSTLPDGAPLIIEHLSVDQLDGALDFVRRMAEKHGVTLRSANTQPIDGRRSRGDTAL